MVASRHRIITRSTLALVLGVMEILVIIVVLAIVCIIIFINIGQRSTSKNRRNKPLPESYERIPGPNKASDVFLRGHRSNTKDVFWPINTRGKTTKSSEDVFTPVQAQLFGRGKAKLNLDAPCYLTGQPMSLCKCEECINLRSKYDN